MYFFYEASFKNNINIIWVYYTYYNGVENLDEEKYDKKYRSHCRIGKRIHILSLHLLQKRMYVWTPGNSDNSFWRERCAIRTFYHWNQFFYQQKLYAHDVHGHSHMNRKLCREIHLFPEIVLLYCTVLMYISNFILHFFFE